MGGLRGTACNQAYEVQKAAELYRLKRGDWPRSLGALTGPVRILERVPVDPWGRDYLDVRPSPGSRDVVSRSAGGDGVFFTDDDVGNWPIAE